ncbi:methyltransferase domain-containing protein [Fundidesulfovibrio agrisoli]|uniref:methyltransferase domain-containing protein n=1 Tax=Fundidesulfovibrio agrisoli TaxID=2922717 RepID=UPI001FAB6C98|nr:methyltransferase domain-containing protein [Fundidesulfovibrio agrisoli]
MIPVSENTHATLDLTVTWRSPEALHEERYLLRNANPWRDIYPPGVKEAITGLCAGEKASFDYAPGSVTPDWDERLVRTLPRKSFKPQSASGHEIQPLPGRFYPQGFFEGLPGVYPQNVLPARVLDASAEELTIDLNHPMAGRALRLDVAVADVRPKPGDTGGALAHLMERVCDHGPGMQAPRRDGSPTEFDGPGALARKDEAPDGDFYASPRLVNHVDTQASAHLADIHARLVSPGARVLDLMSSCATHLPPGFAASVTGLGLNSEEMAANPRLEGYAVHDLNADPRLPYGVGTFDAVLISLSIEYLVRPEQVLAECAKVLKPGGRLAIGFSDRYFPTKAVSLWQELHEFERMGFVAGLMGDSGLFKGLTTHSVRNWWRPVEDPHFPKLLTSDPMFVVTGTSVGGA